MGRNGTALAGQVIIERVNSCIADENTLGIQTYWTLYNNSVDTEQFISAMERHGIDGKLFNHQTDKKRFWMVAQEVAKSHNNKLDGFKVEAKKLSDKKGRTVVKFVKSVANMNEENIYNSKFEYIQDTTVVFDYNNGNPVISGEGVESIIDEVSLSFEYSRSKTTVDYIRTTFSRVLRSANSTTLRGSGGIYFVPFNNRMVLEAIANLTEEFNLGTIYQIRMPNGKHERMALLDGVKNDLLTSLRQDGEKVDKICRPNTLVKKSKSAEDEIKNVVDLYGNILATATEVEERKNEIVSMFQNVFDALNEYQFKLEARMVELED